MIHFMSGSARTGSDSTDFYASFRGDFSRFILVFMDVLQSILMNIFTSSLDAATECMARRQLGLVFALCMLSNRFDAEDGNRIMSPAESEPAVVNIRDSHSSRSSPVTSHLFVEMASLQRKQELYTEHPRV
jgi:hypothetical protein